MGAWLASIPPEVTPQWRRSWCMMKRTLPYDFYVELEEPSIVELDGKQHFFGQNTMFEGIEERRRYDLHKMRCAITKGLPVVRLLTDTVKKDSSDWRAWLLAVFEHRCHKRDGVAPLILHDHPLYHSMYKESLRNDPLIPIVEFVRMS